MDKNYTDASKVLSDFPEFKARANGFLDVDEMNKDSADWTINYLGLNTKNYREFSPLVVDSKFLWSTNEPAQGIVREIASWDGNDYIHILSLTDTSLVKRVDMPSDDLIDTSKNRRSVRIAEHFSLVDNDQLKIVKLPNSLLKKRAIDSFFATPITSEERIKYNIANPSYSPTTQKIYFSVNRQGKLKSDPSTDQKEAVRVLTIAEAKLKDNRLVDINFLPIGSSEYSVMHPAIHPNGKMLVYSSIQQGGKGGFDLFMVNKIDDTTWSNPVALQSLNTAGNELFSSFTSSGELYFSSDGHPGFGGMDIIKSTIGEDGMVKSISYLPEPLNSSHDDFGFIQSTDGKTGFISSDRFLQQDDIYAFDYEKKIVKISGYVFSRYTETRKPGVKIILQKKLKDKSLVEEGSMLTDTNGDFLFKGRPNNEYVLTVDNGGDDIQALNFSTENTFGIKPLGIFYVDKKKEIVVQAPKPDTTRFIIYFAFDKYNLTNKAKRVLDQAAAMLKGNTNLKAVLDGHTDLWGGDQYNLDLSNRRVKEACGYLSKTGLDESQTDCSQYYGKQRPVFNTLDRTVSSKNRRVEILVTNK
jgi:outer membrane protein OmpA-like peptidoglycan-associated protein